MVPNSTAGMIIGKGGSFIKEIKNKTGAFIQVSQKSKEMNLAERCITVGGAFLSLFFSFLNNQNGLFGSFYMSEISLHLRMPYYILWPV